MKTLKNVQLTILTDARELKLNFDINTDNLDKVVGTSLNRIFEFSELLRNVKSKGIIKASEKINVVIDVDGVNQLDTVKLNETIQARLSFGRNAKSKKQFAKNIIFLLSWSISEIKEMTTLEVLSKLG